MQHNFFLFAKCSITGMVNVQNVRKRRLPSSRLHFWFEQGCVPPPPIARFNAIAFKKFSQLHVNVWMLPLFTWFFLCLFLVVNKIVFNNCRRLRRYCWFGVGSAIPEITICLVLIFFLVAAATIMTFNRWHSARIRWRRRNVGLCQFRQEKSLLVFFARLQHSLVACIRNYAFYLLR